MLRMTVAFNNLPEFGSDVHDLLGQIVVKATHDLQGRMQERIQEPHATGRIYPRPGGKFHQASAPGESPATDLGHLVNSIVADTQHARTQLLGEVTVGAEYGSHLEFGTVKMAPRPFLAPSIDEIRPAFEAASRAAMKRAGDQNGQ